MKNEDDQPLILVVDDDLKNLQVAGRTLEKSGYKISMTQSGNEAIEVAKEAGPDLILLDIMMPDMDGFEVCKRFKKSSNLSDIPVIFLTMKNELEDILKGFEVGGVDFITKPFHESEFLSRVKTHLEIKLSREKILKQQKDMVNLLENLGQGFMIFNEEGVVSPGSTKVVENFFKTSPTGKNISEILRMNDDEKKNFSKWCRNVWSGKINFKDLVSLAPRSFEKIEGKYLEFEYRPIYEKSHDKKLSKVICITSDKTKEREFKLKAIEQQEKGVTYNLILTNTIEFLDLVTDANDAFWNLGIFFDKGMAETKIDDIFRKIHTLKARFSQFKMGKFVRCCHDFESHLSILQGKKNIDVKELQVCEDYLKALVKLLGNFQIENKGLLELANKVFFLDDRNFRSVKVSSVKDFLVNEFGEDSKSYTSFKDKFILGTLDLRFKDFSHLIYQLSSPQGKEVRFEVKESSIRLDLDRYSDFLSSCIHIFRNAIDHGIETVEERVDKNKGEVGLIIVDIKKNKNNLKIIIEDDGRGIDPKKIKKVAGIEKGKLNKMKDEELLQLIFHQGVSSKEKVDEISGRGVGLEAVKSEVEKLGGEIKVESKLEMGTTFIIGLPIYN